MSMTEQRDEAVVEGHKQAERAERLATALRRVRAIASDGLADCHHNVPKLAAGDLNDILAEIARAGL